MKKIILILFLLTVFSYSQGSNYYYYYANSEITYNGTELITNSIDRTMELGTAYGLNGSFTTDANWTKEAGWGIVDGVASKGVTTDNSIYQFPAGMSTSLVYNFKFTITALTSGQAMLFSGSGLGLNRTTTGTYAQMLNAGAGGIYVKGTLVGSVDNVEVKLCANLRPAGNHLPDTTYLAHAGSFGVEIVSTGAGSSATNYVYMPSTRFTAVTNGSYYRFKIWAYTTTASTTLTFNLGDITVTQNVPTSGWTELNYDFKATASTTGNIKLYNNQTASVLIDDLSMKSGQ